MKKDNTIKAAIIGGIFVIIAALIPISKEFIFTSSKSKINIKTNDSVIKPKNDSAELIKKKTNRIINNFGFKDDKKNQKGYGQYDTITILSNPNNASIYINDSFYGVTNTELIVPKKNNLIRVEKDGYKPQLDLYIPNQKQKTFNFYFK